MSKLIYSGTFKVLIDSMEFKFKYINWFFYTMKVVKIPNNKMEDKNKHDDEYILTTSEGKCRWIS